MKHIKLGLTPIESFLDCPMSAGDVALKNATLSILERASRAYTGCVSATPESCYIGAPSGCVGEVRVKS